MADQMEEEAQIQSFKDCNGNECVENPVFWEIQEQFKKHYTKLTEGEVFKFYKGSMNGQANATFIWGITHFLYESLWTLQEEDSATDASVQKGLLHWLKANTPLRKQPVSCSDAESLSRFVVAFSLLAQDWQPDPIIFNDDHSKSLQIPEFCEAMLQQLLSIKGIIPAEGPEYQYMLENMPPIQLIQFDAPPRGILLPSHSPRVKKAALKDQPPLKAVQVQQQNGTHSGHITGSGGTHSQPNASTFNAHSGSSGKNVQLPEAEDTQAQGSMQFNSMWKAIQDIQAKLTTPSVPALPASQADVNLEMLKVLQDLRKKPDKPSIPKIWKQTLLAPIVCHKVVQQYHKADVTYLQKAYVKAAKMLLKLYELNEADQDASADPDIIAESSQYYDLAVLNTECMKSVASAIAFPTSTKPCDKEQKQVFSAVMGGDISAGELSKAFGGARQGNYPNNNPKKGSGRGSGREDTGGDSEGGGPRRNKKKKQKPGKRSTSASSQKSN